MVSTREILYVLLISLAASSPVVVGDDPALINGTAGLPYGALLPLLLLLLLSTDTPNVVPPYPGCPRRCGPFGPRSPLTPFDPLRRVV